MSDKRESREDTDFWGGAYTNKTARKNDKEGWGVRKTSVHLSPHNWHKNDSTADSLQPDAAPKPSPARTAIRSPTAEVAKYRMPDGARSNVPASPPDRSSDNLYPIIGCAAAVIVVLLIAVAINDRRSSTGSDAATISSSTNGATSAFVNTKDLNVRTGPGSEYGVVTKLTRGDELTRLGVGQSADGGQWARVRFGSTEGWVNQKLISDSKPLPVEASPNEGDTSFGGMTVSLGSVNGTQIVGLTVSEAARALNMKLVMQGEKFEGCFYVKPSGSDPGISFMVNDGTIGRVDIDGNKFQYEGGVKVGDSEAKLRSVFGNRLEVEPHTYDEGGKYYKLVRGKFGVVFETDGKSVTSIRSGRSPEFEYVEGCS